MPFAQIYMLEGRTEEQERAVIEKVTQALVEAVGAPKEKVRVWIHDVPKENCSLMTAKVHDKQDTPNAFNKEEGSVNIGGIDALVRLVLDQTRADERRGLKTGMLISGYRGSPVGMLDAAFIKNQKALLARKNVLYGMANAPRIVGVFDEDEKELLPHYGEFESDVIGRALTKAGRNRHTGTTKAGRRNVLSSCCRRRHSVPCAQPDDPQHPRPHPTRPPHRGVRAGRPAAAVRTGQAAGDGQRPGFRPGPAGAWR
jgi:4-oxalocrotonate tautomerase family enzyme